MNKAVKILEKNAEWIALGVAAAWIGWIGWGYFMAVPTKTLDQDTVGTSDIDNHIQTNAIRKLEGAMTGSPTVAIPDPVIKDILPKVPASQMPAMPPVSSAPAAKPIVASAEVKTSVVDKKIDVLPSIPAPKIVISNKGLSQVTIRAMVSAADATATGAAGGVVAVVPAGVATADAPSVAMTVVDQGSKDKVWSSVFGQINDKAILEEYQRIGITSATQLTRRYIRVELERTELYNGKMIGQGVIVPQLPMNIPPYNPEKDLTAFQQWLEPTGGINDVMVQILQPDFYPILKGDSWILPPALNDIIKAIAPTAVSPVVGAVPVAVPIPAPVPVGPGVASATPTYATPTAVTQFQRPAQFGMDPDGNYLIWQHDDSGIDGKTYVYRMRVVLKNPLYKSSKAEDKVADVFEVASQWSEYSSPVAMPSKMKWYVLSASPTGGTIRVKAAKFDQGEQNTSTEMTASVGDIVGNLDALKNVDYSTGWMLADIRQVGTYDRNVDTRITLMNSQGQTIVRWLKQDMDDYKKNFPTTQPATPAAGAPVPVGG